jgi:DNA repair protein RecO (recombination protein O)
VLHTRPYRESSLLVEVFTRDYGRLSLLAKGARRLKSRVRGLLRPFQSLLLSWSGRGDLPILTAAEPDQIYSDLTDDSRLCGFYINELLMYLLHRYDAHTGLFVHYQQVLARLTQSLDYEWPLRIFEKHLLRELGYALNLEYDAKTSQAIDPNSKYSYVPELGAIKAGMGSHNGIVVNGATLIALQREESADERIKDECKRLMRAMINRQLGQRVLHSRRIFNGRRTTTKGRVTRGQA